MPWEPLLLAHIYEEFTYIAIIEKFRRVNSSFSALTILGSGEVFTHIHEEFTYIAIIEKFRRINSSFSTLTVFGNCIIDTMP